MGSFKHNKLPVHVYLTTAAVNIGYMILRNHHYLSPWEFCEWDKTMSTNTATVKLPY